MPQITLPEINLPEARLPEGLRRLSRDDIQHAMPDIHMRDIELPKVDLSKIDLAKELSRRTSHIELPDEIESRLPNRRRGNPFPMIVAIAVGLAAATWLVFASPFGPRIRRSVSDMRTRLGMGNGTTDMQTTDVTAYEVTTYEATPAVDTYRATVGVGPGFDGQHEGDVPETAI